MSVSVNHKIRLYGRYRPVYAPSSPDNNTWKHIAEVTNYEEFRQTSEILEFRAVSRRYAIKAKGGESIPDWSITFGFDYRDEGQTLMRAAKASDYDFQFKMPLRDFFVDPNGATITRTWTTLLFRAYVADFGVNPGGVGAFLMGSSRLAILPSTFQMIRPSTTSTVPTVEEEVAETDDFPFLEAPYVTEETGEE